MWRPLFSLSLLRTFIFFTFYNCIVQMGLLPSEIRVAFPGESQLRQSRATQPPVHAGCSSVSIIHRTRTWTMRSLTCAQMLLNVIAHGKCSDTVRESALKADSGEKNSLPNRGIEPASAACRVDALPTELHPHPSSRQLLPS